MKKIGRMYVNFWGECNVYMYKGFKVTPFIFNGKLAYDCNNGRTASTAFSLNEAKAIINKEVNK